MRIPTLLGLSLLLSLLLLSVMYQLYNSTRQSRDQQDFTPTNIRYSNVTDNSLTITWVSQKAGYGSLTWGPTPQLGNPQNDSRDLTNQSLRTTHTVTLNSLSENSIYYIKIRNGPFFYPEQPLIINTAQKLPVNSLSALTGRVLDENFQPLEDALVFLEIPGASLSSGFVSTEGNFIIPLSTIKSEDFSKNFSILANTQAYLIIQKGNLQSRAKITLPLSKPLPPLIFGQDTDITK